jgi:hypothetical protein
MDSFFFELLKNGCKNRCKNGGYHTELLLFIVAYRRFGKAFQTNVAAVQRAG